MSVLNVLLQRLDFDRLDFGETNALDVFYNADVALVDISLKQQVPSLCYHIGVRESMGQSFNVILNHFTEGTSEFIVNTTKVKFCLFFFCPLLFFSFFFL